MRPEPAERRAVLVGEDGLDQWLGSGMCIALGGLATACHAMVAVRHIIRRNLRDLTVIGSAVGGLDVDLLIGAGCVRKVISPYVGAEALAPIGPFFRAAAERGDIPRDIDFDGAVTMPPLPRHREVRLRSRDTSRRGRRAPTSPTAG